MITPFKSSLFSVPVKEMQYLTRMKSVVMVLILLLALVKLHYCQNATTSNLYCSSEHETWKGAFTKCASAHGHLPHISDPQVLGFTIFSSENGSYVLWTGDKFGYTVSTSHNQPGTKYPHDMCLLITVNNLTRVQSSHVDVHFHYELNNCRAIKNYMHVGTNGSVVVSKDNMTWIEANRKFNLWTAPVKGIDNFPYGMLLDLSSFPLKIGTEYWVANAPVFSWNNGTSIFCGALYVTTRITKLVNATCNSSFGFLCHKDSGNVSDSLMPCADFFAMKPPSPPPTDITISRTDIESEHGRHQTDNDNSGVAIGVSVGMLTLVITIISVVLACNRQRLKRWKYKRQSTICKPLKLFEQPTELQAPTSDHCNSLKVSSSASNPGHFNNPSYNVVFSSNNVHIYDGHADTNHDYDVPGQRKNGVDVPVNLYHSTKNGSITQAYDSTITCNQPVSQDDSYSHPTVQTVANVYIDMSGSREGDLAEKEDSQEQLVHDSHTFADTFHDDDDNGTTYYNTGSKMDTSIEPKSEYENDTFDDDGTAYYDTPKRISSETSLTRKDALQGPMSDGDANAEETYYEMQRPNETASDNQDVTQDNTHEICEEAKHEEQNYYSVIHNPDENQIKTEKLEKKTDLNSIIKMGRFHAFGHTAQNHIVEGDNTYIHPTESNEDTYYSIMFSGNADEE